MERRFFVKSLVGAASLAAAGTAVASNNKDVNKCSGNVFVFDNIDDAKKHSGFSHMDRALIRSNGYFYEFNKERLLVDSNSKSEITFDSKVHILVESGGLLKFCDIEKAKSLHSINKARFFSKIKNRNSTISVDCYGDSITFGQALPDTATAKNMNNVATLFGDASFHQQWQFNDNYPNRLKSTLSKFLPQSVEVNNYGYSGDRAWTGFIRHREKSTSDMSIIMYGINDCLYASSNGSNPKDITDSHIDSVESYICAMRMFVINQIINGKACILVGSTTFASLVGYDDSSSAAMKLVRAYNSACNAIAKEFGCMYIDPPTEIFSQYGIGEITQEGTHLNEIGMEILANRIFSAIVSIEHITVADHGSIVVINPTSVPLLSKSDVVALPNSTSSTPIGTIDNKKTTINVNENGVCIPFFSSCPDLVLFINGVCSSAGAEFFVSIDGEALQSDYHYQSEELNGRPISGKVLNKSTPFNRGNCNFSDDKAAYLTVSSPGWHFLEVRKVSGSASVLIDSLSFEAVADVMAKDVVGCTAKACVKSGILSKNVNVKTVIKIDSGVYRVSFENEMFDDEYGVSVTPHANYNANIYRVFDKTKQGFSMSFMQGAGEGKGVDFQMYDPSSISLSVIGGR